VLAAVGGLWGALGFVNECNAIEGTGFPGVEAGKEVQHVAQKQNRGTRSGSPLGSALAFGRGAPAAHVGGARGGFVHAGGRAGGFAGPVARGGYAYAGPRSGRYAGWAGRGRYWGRPPVVRGVGRPWIAPAPVAYPACGYYDQYGQWMPYTYDAYGNPIPCGPSGTPIY
jgi:hypothetical protein